MARENAQILQSSEDPAQLTAAALSLARSKQSGDHRVLFGILRSRDFLARLDTDERYRQLDRQLNLERIVKALVDNQSPSAHVVLVSLTQEKDFIARRRRAEILILACRVIRPATPAVIQFWDAFSQPNDGYTNMTLNALVDNGSAPAISLFETKLADPAHSDASKINWMHTGVLAHRSDLLLLEACERLIKGPLPERLRPALTETLFDYRPGEWFVPASVVPAPTIAQASPESLAQLRKIGEWVLQNVQLDETQKAAVKKTLEAIRERTN